MRDIVFCAGLFSSERDRARSEAVIKILLSALVESNVRWLKEHPGTPKLYESGVRYRREPTTEVWKGIPALYADKAGDCEDLASARAAELIVAGIAARPAIRFRRRDGIAMYHVVVELPGGKIEDPSRKLGM